MVVRHLLHVLDEAVVVREQVEARGQPAVRLDDRERLDLGQVVEVDGLEPLDAVLGLGDPLLVDRVPVVVVVAGALGEELRPLRDQVRIGDRVRADVEVAVDDPLVDAQGGRDHVHARPEHVQGDPPALGHDRVEGVDRLGVVHPLEEPELALLELAARLAEEVVVRVEPAPVLSARRRVHREGAREAADLRCDRHQPHISCTTYLVGQVSAEAMPRATISSVSPRCARSTSVAASAAPARSAVSRARCCSWEVRKLPAVDTYRRR